MMTITGMDSSSAAFCPLQTKDCMNKGPRASQNLGGDSAAEVHATQSHGLQRQIAGFSGVDGNKKSVTVRRERTLTFHSRREIAAAGSRAHFLVSQRRLFSALGVAQEIENVHQAGTGKNAFVADVSETARR